MKNILFALLILALVAGGLWWFLLAPPSRYDYVLERCSDGQTPPFFDVHYCADAAATWAQISPLRNLRFFESELDSPDPSHVKAGLYSLSFLTAAIESSSQGGVSAEVKMAYDKALPVAKINTLLSAHPEYAHCLMPLGRSKKAALFPLLIQLQETSAEKGQH